MSERENAKGYSHVCTREMVRADYPGKYVSDDAFMAAGWTREQVAVARDRAARLKALVENEEPIA
jgi:tetraacyldisaccharide-1-P 4'-kinase